MFVRTKPVIFKRYATFGSSTPEKTFVWADFKRFDNLVENAEKNLDFDKRIKALETKKSPIPIGLIAIWGKPATEPIPEGWKECMDLRGRFPLGWNPDDEDFKKLGKEDGEKTHTLTIDEMPEHRHAKNDVFDNFIAFGDELNNNYTVQGSTNAFGGDKEYALGIKDQNRYNREDTIEQYVGSNKPHNNMPPYRIIKFIEFVGFEN